MSRTRSSALLLAASFVLASACDKGEAPGASPAGASAVLGELTWDESVPRLIRNGPLSRLELADLLVRSMEQTGRDRMDDVEALLADDARKDPRAAIIMGRARSVGMSADLREARSWFDLADLNGGDKGEIVAGRAVLAHLAGDVDEAIDLLRRVPPDHRDAAHLEGMLGQLLREAGRLDEAEKHLERSAKVPASGGDADFQLALIAEERGDMAAYAKAIDETLRRDAAHPGARLARARLRQREGHEGAEKDAEIHRLIVRNSELKQRPPDDEAAAIERIANARRLVELEPEVGTWRSQLIEPLVARKRYPEAIDVIKDAASRDLDPSVVARLARLAYELDDLALAEAMAKRALAELPASSGLPARNTAAATLGACLLRAGRGPEALASLEVAAAAAPQQDDVRTLHAHALRAAGQPGAALREYWAAYQIQPENVHALAGLAGLLQEAGRSDEAQEALAEATRMAPDEPAVEAARVVVLAGRGDVDGAIIAAQRASHLAPEDRVLHYQAGLLLLGAGRAEEAVPELEQATRADGVGPVPPRDASLLLDQARRAAAQQP